MTNFKRFRLFSSTLNDNPIPPKLRSVPKRLLALSRVQEAPLPLPACFFLARPRRNTAPTRSRPSTRRRLAPQATCALSGFGTGRRINWRAAVLPSGRCECPIYGGRMRQRRIGPRGRLHQRPPWRPFGYCASHSRPLNDVTVNSPIVSESMQRALMLKPSGCERGT